MDRQPCRFLNIDRLTLPIIKRTLEELGLLSRYISRQDALKEHSLTKLMNAERGGELTKIKNGNHNAKVKYDRAEYDKFNRKSNLK